MKLFFCNTNNQGNIIMIHSTVYWRCLAFEVKQTLFQILEVE